MIELEFSENFSRIFSRIKDNLMILKIKKQIKKIALNPKVGKPMRNVRKGTREVYVKPFRLSYEFVKEKNVVYILDLYHKKRQ